VYIISISNSISIGIIFIMSTLETSKFVLASPLWKQLQSNLNFNTVSRVVSICHPLLGHQSDVRSQNTALQNKIMLKVPSGKQIYK